MAKTYEVEISEAAPEGILLTMMRASRINSGARPDGELLLARSRYGRPFAEMTEMDAVNLGYDLGEEIDLKGAKDFKCFRATPRSISFWGTGKPSEDQPMPESSSSTNTASPVCSIRQRGQETKNLWA